MPVRKISSIIFLFVSLFANADTAVVPSWKYEIVQKFEHPGRSFTQGLEIIGNDVYESSGLYANSYLSRWTLSETPQQIKKILSPSLFAEGLTIVNGKGYLVTWQNKRGFVFDPKTLRISSEFRYEGEGWGLTNDKNALIMSNGTAELQWLSLKNYSLEKKLTVKMNGKEMTKINELEWVNGKIFANIWQSNNVIVINPENGNVIASIDFSELTLAEKNNPEADVLNGIAYDKRNNTFLITGKKWQWVYRIRLLEH
jgi:glutamine cyclotransferase